ncbi:granzyme M-like [Battus philenor]|uniref:granzyme M-like n=1 Tax=Battus philenor TaxID=42288 RepID=UPI0035CE9513
MLQAWNCILFLLVLEHSDTKSPLRIIGGKDVDPGAYPYVVRMELRIIRKNGTLKFWHICTASALSATWALTAGHCVQKKRKGLVVRYGHAPFSLTTALFSDVVSTVLHPLFTNVALGWQRKVTKNDIGLLKTTPMMISSYSKLSAVDYLTLYGHEILISGYGITNKTLPDGQSMSGSTLQLQMPLQVLKLLVVKCRQRRLLPGICLARQCGPKLKTVCGGDSGGPLFHPSGQIGVLSLGEKTKYCLIRTTKRRVIVAGQSSPISPYIEWIYSYVTL